MQSMYELVPPGPGLRTALAGLYALDPDFLAIEAEAGPLTVLTLPPSFAALVRIIVGQQLSTAVARAIFERLRQSVSLEPAALLEASDETLKAAGLSRAKIACCRAAAAALAEGHLDLEACRSLDQAQVMAALTAIKGIGPWTAEIFMLFALERYDVFPAGDLALQRAYAWLKHLEQAPDARQLGQAVSGLTPYRGAAAYLLWHFYRSKKS
ncbi:MAG: DNA-3-methyladenine glycosylase [Candidatus Sericytochromatia bacterium]